jgi:uncharacterized membrane protein
MNHNKMRLWFIPMIYAAGSFICGLVLPRIEDAYLPSYAGIVSVASAQAFLSAVASGMMALTGIVFAIAFVTVQFSAIAYSPRLVLWTARDPTLFHSLGVFVATFVYALATLLWTDRGGSGAAPLFSSWLVVALLALSILLFSRLVRRLDDLQITNVLRLIGEKGREVIHEMSQHRNGRPDAEGKTVGASVDDHRLGPVVQTLKYSGEPQTISKFDIDGLVRQAQQAGAVIAMSCAVGDTIVEDTLLLRVHGAKERLPEEGLLRAIHLGMDRTYEQDPKYPIRLLVDIAIRALSPAINDPTTAVQAIDQIEDLLHRLGRLESDTGYAADANGVLRLVFPMSTWEDYLSLAFDEIRQYGAGSVQVLRRLRSALVGLAESLESPARTDAVQGYLKHLDLMIGRSSLDAEDQVMARQEDRQGLGLSRGPAESKNMAP